MSNKINICITDKWFQILPITKFIRTFIDETPLCVCSDEIQYIKRNLLKDSDEMKLKQKTSQVVLKLNEGKYTLTVKLTVPDNYPHEQVG